jgi:hypothetical protein
VVGAGLTALGLLAGGAGIQAVDETEAKVPPARPAGTLLGEEAGTLCGTRPGREEEVLETFRLGALRRGEGLVEDETGSRALTVLPAGEPLPRILGSDGNIENGSVIDVGDVTVLVDDGSGIFGSFRAGFSVDIVRLARQYYAGFPDDVDTLALLPDFDHQSGTFHLLIRNDVTGINRPIIDDSPLYGSSGRLQSLLVFSNFLRKPIDPGARIPGDNNSALSLMAHEFAHRFGAYVGFATDPGPDVERSNRLLGRSLAHWCFYHDTRAAFRVGSSQGSNMSVLEGNRWLRNVLTGLWNTAGVTDGYSPLDLYLMGLMAPEEVPPFTVLTGEGGLDSLPTTPSGAPTGSDCATSPLSVPPQVAATVAALTREVTLDDVIAVEGPRVPDHFSSQKAFRQALVLVARQERFPTPATIARLNRLRQEWEPYYAAATGGRGSVDTWRPTRPGPAVTFAIVRIPDDVQAGRPVPMGILALDADGRAATDFTGAVRLTSSTDPDATLPGEIIFQESDAGYLLMNEELLFSTGGEHSLTVSAVADGNITGTRSGLTVEGPVDVHCIYDPSPEPVPTGKPWGAGAAFSTIGGVRFQYLIHADAIGRPGVIRNLDWPVLSSPEAVQWENLVIRMAHRIPFALQTNLQETSLDINLSESFDVTNVLLGFREQLGMQESGRVHMVLDTPFNYNGIDHLLIDVKYTGGGPPGVMNDLVFADGKVINVERLGPNLPVQLNRTSSLCLGMRVANGSPPTISGVTVGAIRNVDAEISWITSPSTDGRVEFGLADAPLDQTTGVQRFAFSHTALITGLLPDTEYDAAVISRDLDAQESRSAPVRFRTDKRFPQIFGLTPAGLRPNTNSNRVLISGANFFPGLIAAVVAPDLDGPGPPPIDPDLQVVFTAPLSENLLDIRVVVSASAPAGPRRIHVTNTDGFDVYSDVFLGVIPPIEANDIDTSGRVDGFDLIRLARAFGSTFGGPRYDLQTDLDGNGAIDGVDLTRLANNFGRTFTP